jgi:hypothetical protein
MGGDRTLQLLLADGAFLHTCAEQAIQLQKNTAMAGFLALALLGHGAWSLDQQAGASRLARAVAEALSRPRRVERLI